MLLCGAVTEFEVKKVVLMAKMNCYSGLFLCNEPLAKLGVQEN